MPHHSSLGIFGSSPLNQGNMNSARSQKILRPRVVSYFEIAGSFTVQMDRSETGANRTPLGDRTNTIIQGDLDPNARKRQRDKERYASMSREKKDERNRIQRERRQGHKGLADENAPNEEGNQDPHCTETGDLDPNERRKQRDRERYASMPREKKDERNRKQSERRRHNKLMTSENAQIIRQDEDANEWLHRGVWHENELSIHESTHNQDGILSSGQDNIVDIPLNSAHGYAGHLGQGDGDGGIDYGQGTLDDDTDS